VDTAAFTLLIFLASAIAGLLGALTGLGGGAIIVPLLVVAFGVDLRYAIGASLVAVIATSSGSAAAFVKEGFTNVRLAMVLEVATTVGALLGAFLAARTAPPTLSIMFGIVLLWTATNSLRPPKPKPIDTNPDSLGNRLRLSGTFPSKDGPQAYSVHHVPWGFAVMFGAGVLSAMLGLGSGVLKVFAMDRLMRVPFKVSTTTSNFMIGVTAAASAGVYLSRGQIEPGLAGPVALGTLAGSMIGARLLHRLKTKWLRFVFAGMVILAATQMIYKGVTGNL
jgi:uncharacterized membrane protein YfcA